MTTPATPTRLTQRLRSERGVTLIHVGAAIFVIMAFSAFVLDHGVMMLARGEAQNAADAGALAGAIARAFDEPVDNPAPNGLSYQSAVDAATTNEVFNEAGGLVVSWACPPEVDPDVHCVRVDVHRDGTTASNQLPVYFSTLFGLNGLNVRATATAWVGAANASECMKPFAVPDLFAGSPASYTFPGYTLDQHEGTFLMLKGGPGTQLSPGWFRLLDLVGGGGGGAGGVNGTRNQIRACIPEVHEVGEDLPNQNGNQASIIQALDDLYNLDPNATWNSTLKKVEGSCTETNSCRKYVWGSNGNGTVPDPGRAYSPRVMAMPLFDPAIYAATGEIKVVNIMGFFLLNDGAHPLPSQPNFDVWGVLMSQPGLLVGGAGVVPEDAAFLKIISLIR